MSLDAFAPVLAADPILRNGLELGTSLAIIVVKVVLAFTFVIVGVILMVWFERKVISDFQNRIGPNRAGPFGILQTLADGLKLIFKEDVSPTQSRRLIYRLAPYLSVAPAFLTFCIVPVGGDFLRDDGAISLFGHETYLQVADPPIGILFLLAMSAIAVYGVMLAGWSSGSKYPLLGSIRASAQMVSYEAALGLSVVTVVLLSGSLSTHDIVASQAGDLWNAVRAVIVPFAIFTIAATAEMNRPPFDLVEAEQELVGGFNTEYSSIRFGMFFLAEYMNLITMSAIIVTLFLGGPAPIWPFSAIDIPGAGLLGLVWFSLKLVALLFGFVWVRATLPRFRYDQLMDLGWKRLIPVALGWMLLIAAVRVGRDEDWFGDNGMVNAIAVIAIAVLVFLVAAAAIAGALRVADKRRQDDDRERSKAGVG